MYHKEFFFPSLGCLFILSKIFQKVLNFKELPFIRFCLWWGMLLVSCLGTLGSTLNSKKFSYIFFSLKVLQFYIEVHSPFWILCGFDEELGQRLLFCPQASNCSSTISKVSSPHWIALRLFQLSVGHFLCGSISGFSVLFYWSMYVTLCQHQPVLL